ncbi:MAG: hypothetical protein EOP09_11545, partial [Proteobacteria bacterium]
MTKGPGVGLLSLFAFLLLTQPAWSADGSFIHQFEKILNAQLVKRVKTLRRPIQTYHYGTRGRVNRSFYNAYQVEMSFGIDEAIPYLDQPGQEMTPAPLHPQAAAMMADANAPVAAAAPAAGDLLELHQL